MAREPCMFSSPKGPDGCYPLSEFLLLAEKNCEVAFGSCFALEVVPLDSHGHPAKDDLPSSFECRHDDAPKKGKRMSDAVEAAPEPAPAPLPAPALPVAAPLPAPALPVAAPPPAPQAHVAVPSTPDTALAEVKALIPANGDAGVATVLLAAIGVAGGGAAWKFYNAHSKRKHDEKMKELAIKQERVEQKNENNHEKCSAERVALEAKVTALETRLSDAEQKAADAERKSADADRRSSDAERKAADAERKAAGVELPFDVEELKERLEKLEKAAKARKASRPR